MKAPAVPRGRRQGQGQRLRRARVEAPAAARGVDLGAAHPEPAGLRFPPWRNGRVAAVGTLTQIRDLLDDHPLTVRVDVDDPRELARHLLAVPEVVGVEVASDGPAGLVVRARSPKRFFQALSRLVVERQLEVRRLEPLDESAHDILGYLLGGSGRT